MGKLLAEYEAQKAICVLFPYREDIWRDKARPAQNMIVDLVNQVAVYEPVLLGVIPHLLDFVKNTFTLHENVRVVGMEYNDSWARDTLSSVICEGDRKFVNAFGFNSYGTPLYTPYDDDQRLNRSVFEKEFGYLVQDVPVVLEWGNIMPDGNGTIFVVEETIVNENRNPGKTRAEIEAVLLEATHSKQVVWIPRGLMFDETGGHVDNVLAFADANTVIFSYTDDKNNPHYERTQEIYAFLMTVKNADGQAYKLIKLPVPAPRVRSSADSHGICQNDVSVARIEGDTVLYTYVNFVTLNGAIVAPMFGIPEDEKAKKILEQAFPDRDVIQLNAHEAFIGGGGFHCLTKHIN